MVSRSLYELSEFLDEIENPHNTVILYIRAEIDKDITLLYKIRNNGLRKTSGYHLFFKDKVNSLRPDLSNKSVAIGDAWRNLSKGEKKIWRTDAEEINSLIFYGTAWERKRDLFMPIMKAQRLIILGPPQDFSDYAKSILNQPYGLKYQAYAITNTRWSTDIDKGINLCQNLEDGLYIDELIKFVLKIDPTLKYHISKYYIKKELYDILIYDILKYHFTKKQLYDIIKPYADDF